MFEMLKNAKKAKSAVACLSTEQKNKALLEMAQALLNNKENILSANALDVEKAKSTVSSVMIDRLMLTSSRIDAMAEGIRQVALLPDPVGRLLEETTREDGLKIQKISVREKTAPVPRHRCPAVPEIPR